MKHLAFCLPLLFALIGCQQAQPGPTDTRAPRALGIVEIAFDAATKTTTASLVRPQGVLSPQGSVTFTPTALSVVVDGSNRFLSATFNVTNLSGSSLQDLTLVALHQSGNRADTAVRNLQDFSGGTINLDAYARALKPTHGMTGSVQATVNSDQADLQLFTESEIGGLQAQAGGLINVGEYLFPYGYMARASTTSRLIAVPAANESTGSITIGVKVPGSNEPTGSAYRFSMTFIAFTQPVPSREVESAEEQGDLLGVPVAARASSQIGFGASEIAVLAGGTNLLANEKLVPLCRVRTAGTALSPLAFLGPNPIGGNPGSLDLCFGASGLRSADQLLEALDQLNDLAVQPDGRIVVVTNVGEDFGLYRFLPDGRVDPSFGVNGQVISDFGYGDFPHAIALQADGKIVVVGTSQDRSSTRAIQNEILLVRYNSNGTLDTSFGAGGAVITSFGINDTAYDLAIQADGKIVVAGTTTISVTTPLGNGIRFAGRLTRYTTAGALDSSFGDSGTRLAFESEYSNTLTLQSDGKILLAGTIIRRFLPSGDSNNDFAVERFTETGSIDVSFGIGGVALLQTDATNEVARAVTLQPDGRILIVGPRSRFNGVTGYFETDWAIGRLNLDGSTDPSFGVGGIVTSSFGSGDDQPNAVAVQNDGKILVGGYTTVNRTTIALARYLSDGSLDASFGLGGKVVTPVRDAVVTKVNGLALQTDGKIVVIAFTSLNSVGSGRTNFLLSRYMP